MIGLARGFDMGALLSGKKERHYKTVETRLVSELSIGSAQPKMAGPFSAMGQTNSGEFARVLKPEG